MKNVSRFALWLLLFCLGSLVMILVLVPILLSLIGYQVNASSSTVAEAAAKKRDVTLCKTILSYGLLRPQSGELRSHCVKTYASLTKDPSACELLMPSSYGWSCLGAAEESNARMCWFDFSKEPYSNSKPVMPECGGKNDSSARRCCEMAQLLYVEKESNCNEFNDSAPLHDQCLELVARRERDIHTCSQIQSDHIRIACEVAVRALKKE